MLLYDDGVEEANKLYDEMFITLDFFTRNKDKIVVKTPVVPNNTQANIHHYSQREYMSGFPDPSKYRKISKDDQYIPAKKIKPPKSKDTPRTR